MNEKEESIYEKLDWKPLSYFDNDDSFMPFLGTTTRILEIKNPVYRDLYAKYNKIIKEYPNVCKILELSEKAEIPNEIETKKLIEALDLYYDMTYIEKKDVFFQGMREQYFIFANMNILKKGTDKETE